MTRSEYNEILTQLQNAHTANAIALTLLSKQHVTEDIPTATAPATAPAPSRFIIGNTMVDGIGREYVVDGNEIDGYVPCYRLSADAFGSSTLKVTTMVPVDALRTKDEIIAEMSGTTDTDTDPIDVDADEVDEDKTIKEGN